MNNRVLKTESMGVERRAEARRRGGNRLSWAYLGRLLCAILAVSIVLNSFVFTVDDIAVADGLSMGAVDQEYGAFSASDDREIDELSDFELGGDASEDALIADENTYLYDAGYEESYLYTAIAEELELPIEKIEDIEMISVLGSQAEQSAEEAALSPEDALEALYVEPVLDEEGEVCDYAITALRFFQDAGLMIYTEEEMYVVRLVRPEDAFEVMLERAEQDSDLPAEEAGTGEEPAAESGAALTYELGGAWPVLLSDILNALDADIEPTEVEMVALLGSGESDAVEVEPLEGDYVISALRDFDEARLALYTAEDEHTIVLTNGAAEPIAAEATEVPDAEPVEDTEATSVDSAVAPVAEPTAEAVESILPEEVLLADGGETDPTDPEQTEPEQQEIEPAEPTVLSTAEAAAYAVENGATAIAFDPGDHGLLDGAGDDGTVVVNDPKDAESIAAGIALSEEAGWHFTGWLLSTDAEQTGRVACAAQYLKILTVTAKEQTKVYGEAGEELTAEITGVENPPELVYDVTREEGEDAGSYVVTPAGDAVQSGYYIEYVSANYTIVPAYVTVAIVGDSDSRAYDGEPHTVTGFVATAVNNELYDVDTDFTFTPAEGATLAEGDIIATQTDAGTANMGLSAEQFANVNKNFNVTFDVTDGYQTVTPAPVTLTAVSAFKHLDGAEKTISGFAVNLVDGGAAVTGLTFEGVTASASASTAGSHDVTFTGVTLNETLDSTGNYIVTGAVDGVLTIETLLTKALTGFNGNMAEYTITVNPEGKTINGGRALTLEDTLQTKDEAHPDITNQSIDYSSIRITPSAGASFDYSGYTGTFTLPDSTALTITYTARVLGDAGYESTFGNTCRLGSMEGDDFVDWGSESVSETKTITPTGSDILGEDGVYTIELYAYAQDHLEEGLAGAQFRLLDANQRPITYKRGDLIGREVTFTTGEDGYVTIALDEEADGLSIRKNALYYLEMITAPMSQDGEGHYTYYEKDNTLYSFVITDDPSYTYGDVYSYFNGDVMKVRCVPESVGINITKRFSGNYTPTQEERNGITFVLEKENAATGRWTEVERHTYEEFTYGSLNFETGAEGWARSDYGATYRVREINAEIDGVELDTRYVVSSQSNGRISTEDSNEFLVDPDHEAYSFSLVVTNEYANRKLTIIALDEESGDYLPGAEFTVYAASDPDTAIARYTTGDPNGKVEIFRTDDYQADTLYYAVETHAPTGYLLREPEKFYFYFSGSEAEVPEGLPAGETALDLSESYSTETVPNHSVWEHFPVILAWGLDQTKVGYWPAEVDHVVVTLYQSVDGAAPAAVPGKQVSLTEDVSFDNTTFRDLPALDGEGRRITYSLEETVYGDALGDRDITDQYALSVSVSGTGWYVLRNLDGITVTVGKDWFDLAGEPVSDPSGKPAVAFDLYRAKEEYVPKTDDPVSREDLEAWLREHAELVREGLSLSSENGWTLNVPSLPKTDFSESAYYYFALESEAGMPQNHVDTYAVAAATETDRRKLTIRNTQTPVTVVVDAKDLVKTYGEADPAYDFDVTVQDDSATAVWAAAETEGAYTVTITGSDNSEKVVNFTLNREAGEGAGAYVLTPVGDPVQEGYRVVYQTGTLTVNRASVTVTAGATKIYGDPDPKLVTITGLANGDGEDVISYDRPYREPGEDVDRYAITVGGSAVQGNYNVAFVQGYLTIIQAEAVVTVKAMSKVYGEDDPELTADVSGLKNDDEESVLQYSLARAEGEDVDEYEITLTGEADQGNYHVTLVSGAKFTIIKAPLTVRVEDAEKIYGEADPAWDVTVDGLQYNDPESLIQYNVNRQEGQDVGNYTLTPVLSGDAPRNYALEYEAGTLTILPADLTITPDAVVKGFDDPQDPRLTATVTGFQYQDGSVEPVYAEVEGGVRWTYDFGGGKALTFTLKRTAGTDVGEYDITAAGAVNQGNYQVHYEMGVFSILSIYNIVVSQTTSDPVDVAANPEYSYGVSVDLTGTGLSSLAYPEAFTLGGNAGNSQTLRIPVGARVTVIQTTDNRDYETAMTLDGDDYANAAGNRCEINVDNNYALNFIHSRICLPVVAMIGVDQEEEGAQAAEPDGFMGLPEDVQAIDGEYVRSLQAAIGYPLPTDKYYVYDHATLFDESGTVIARGVTAIQYDDGHLNYQVSSGDFTRLPTGSVLKLYYWPKYICKIGEEKFYTLNAALEYAGDEENGLNGVATIELLLDNVDMPAVDVLTIPDGYDITLTTATEGYQGVNEKATITRSNGLTGSMLINRGTLTLGNLILDGNGEYVSGAEPMVSSSNNLTIEAGATLHNANGVSGSAVSVQGGTAAINGTLTNNTAADGGAVYVGGGAVTIGGTLSENTAASGGAIRVTVGTVTFSGRLTNNTAAGGNGGAVFMTGGTLNLGGTVSGNTAAGGNGGVVFMTGGTVNVSGTIGGNTAASGNTALNGGAFYMEGGAVNVTGGTIKNNVATTDGGALYATGGSVSVTNGTITANTATGGNGGAICYTGPGTVAFSGGTLSGNKAESGNGGAIYQSNGTVKLSGGSINGANIAKNGAAIYTAAGIANFSGVSITANKASEGGAVGMEAVARLFFSGNTQIKDNTATDSSTKKNVYLNVDSDEVINVSEVALGGSADIGIYVADGVRDTRGEVCCSFGSYVNPANLAKFKDDRGVYAVYDDSYKIHWGKSINFIVRYLPDGFPPNTGSGSQLKGSTAYYPRSATNPIYDLVTTLYNTYYNSSITTGMVYSYAYANGVSAFEKFLTSIDWDSENRKWVFKQNDGTTTTNQTVFTIYYSDAAYLSIVNNSNFSLTIDALSVMGKNAVEDAYGYIAVINNVTQKTLLPISAGNLVIPAGGSVRLLFPGAKNKAWSVDGTFTDAVEGNSINYTLDRANGGTEKALPTTTTADGLEFDLSGTTLNSAGGIYEILFEEPTPICKVENGGVEHPFTSLTAAMDYITSPETTLDTEKTATIELLLDYQQPKNDILYIPEGYKITLTTAAAQGSPEAAGKTFTYVGDDATRAAISRSSGDMGSAVVALVRDGTTVLSTDAELNTSLTINNLIFDGKALGQGGEGGAINTSNVKVEIDNCDFKGYTASRGGAVYVKWGRLTVKNSNFTDCKILTNQDKTGGGGIWTTARDLVVENCDFKNCSCQRYPNSGTYPQAGAIFHNINADGIAVHPSDSQKFPTGFTKAASARIEGCSFSNCVAGGSGGTMELDGCKNYVINCTFNGSQSQKSGGNGGALNLYINNNSNVPTDSLLEVKGCTFINCSAPNGSTNGGAIRCNAYSMLVENSTFKNATSNHTGGAISMTTAGTSLEIYGCTFEDCSANNNSGAVKAHVNYLTIGDYTYTDAEGNEQTRHTVFKNCTSPRYGGVWQSRNSGGSTTTVTGASFENCTTTGSSSTSTDIAAGALYVQALSLSMEDVSFTNCTATGPGGALYHDGNGKNEVLSCTFDGCTSDTNGGGAFLAGAKVVARNTTFQNCRAGNNGGGLYISTGNDNEFTDCTFTGNWVTATTGYGGALYINQNSVTMNGGTVSNSKAAYGGGIYQNKGSLTLNGTTISNCYASERGGGIHQSSTLVFNAGSVTGCVAGQGGGVYSSGALTLNGGSSGMTIENCQAKGVSINAETGEATVASTFASTNLGGGIYKAKEALAFSTDNAAIRNCRAYDGGGLYYGTDKTFTFSVGGIVGNTAANNGGGVYQASGTFTVSGGSVGGSDESAKNTAANGGGVYHAGGTLNLSGNGAIAGNSATSNGGGVYHAGGTFTMSGGSVTTNTATRNGGGVYFAGGTYTMSGGSVTDNAATRNGGGVYHAGATFTMSGGSIAGNSATAAGGGIAFDGTSAVVNFSNIVTVQNNTMGASGIPCNVYLDRNSNAIIKNGTINAASYIGVYASDTQDAAHGQAGMPFATYSNASNLARYINDRRPYLYGAQGASDNQVVWVNFVCKITDDSGNVLYKDAACTIPAYYTKLENNEGKTTNNTTAFSALNQASPELYLPGSEEKYSGPYQIQMLAQSYSVTEQSKLTQSHDITLTTASTTPDAYGFHYPADAKSPYATIQRTSGNFSMFNISSGKLTLKKFTVDGGATFDDTGWTGGLNGKNGGLLYLAGTGSAEIGDQATLRNSYVTEKGGAVYISSESSTLEMTGGQIVNCQSVNDGGAVCVANGVFRMSGGEITKCHSGASGGAVNVYAGKRMYMSGGSITRCTAVTKGGGIAGSASNNSLLYFSGAAQVKENTWNGNPNNVHLSTNSNGVINVEGALSPKAQIGIYMDGTENDTRSLYFIHGLENKPFGTLDGSLDSELNLCLYTFVNDRNGLRGGKVPDSNYVHWLGRPVIEVRKTVVSDWSADHDRAFSFTVQLGENDLTNSELRSYGFTNAGESTFELKDGETRSIVLPMSLIDAHTPYTVTETAAAGFTTTVQKDAADPVDSATVAGTLGENINESDGSTSTSVLTFTNTRQTGVVSVTKIVESKEAGYADRDFTFTLRLGDSVIGSEADGKDYPLVDEDGNPLTESLNIKNGVGTFTLRHNETLRVSELPTGMEYTVEENLTAEQQMLYLTRVGVSATENRVGSSLTGTMAEANPVVFVNNQLEIVCKITNSSGNLLYYMDNGERVPAVYFRLEDAFAQINAGNLRTGNGGSYSGAMKIAMVVPDYQMDEPAVLNANRTVTLTTAGVGDADYPYNGGVDDGSGNTAVVARGYNGGSMIVDNGTLTLDNIILDGGSGNGMVSSTDGGIVQVNGNNRLTVNAAATLRNSQVAPGKSGGAISMSQSSMLTMNGAIESCYASDGGGIFAAAGFRSMIIGGQITECGATGTDERGNGGAIMAASDGSTASYITINGAAALTGNSANSNGGAVYSSVTVNVRNTAAISMNTAVVNGGGIYLDAADDDAVSFNMNGGSITGNSTENGDGGGLYSSGASNISSGSFTGNVAGTVTETGKGGAVYVVGGESLTMIGGSITGNKSSEGAVSTGESAKLHFSGNVVIKENTAMDDTTKMDVYLKYDDTTIITTTGLGKNASIGVYVYGDLAEDDSIVDKHGIGQRNFATYIGSNPDDANLGKFFNDRFESLTGMEGELYQDDSGNYYVRWKGEDLKLYVYTFDVQMDADGLEPLKDGDGHYKPVEEPAPIGGARFRLTNLADDVVVWNGKSNDQGYVVVPWWIEENNGDSVTGQNQATFAANSSYKLEQIATGSGNVLPMGSWVLTIGSHNQVTWQRQDASNGGTLGNRTLEIQPLVLQAPEEGAMMGDTFALYNDRKPKVTFVANGSGAELYSARKGAHDTVRSEVLNVTSTEAATYTITENNPTWNTVFINWATAKNPDEDDTDVLYYQKGDTLLEDEGGELKDKSFFRHSDYDDVTLYAQWVPVVCKITDRDDNLLYIDGSPAIFRTLEEGFAAFNTGVFTQTASSTKPVTPRKIKMLVGSYDLRESLTLERGKTAILTTATTDREKEDGYPAQEGVTTCVIRRAFNPASGEASMIVNKFQLTLTNITLDGMNARASEDDVVYESVSADGGLVRVTEDYAKLFVGPDATLRNSSVTGNGAAVYVAKNAELYLTELDDEASGEVGTITGCKALGEGLGGAVYVEKGGAVIFSEGAITGNTSVSDGAGIYLEGGATLKLSGTPSFGGSDLKGGSGSDAEAILGLSGNFKEGGLTEALNGGAAYARARQDIFLAGVAEEGKPLTDIALTGNLTGVAPGSIWVWAAGTDSAQPNHYYMLKQFAVIDAEFSGTVSEGTYNAFRNARPDADTDCGGEYLRGQSGDAIDGTACVYWTGGYDFSFRKLDGNGNPLAGAKFMLYKNYEFSSSTGTQTVTEPSQKSKADIVVTSTTETGDNVKFEKITPGVSFIVETEVPSTGDYLKTTGDDDPVKLRTMTQPEPGPDGDPDDETDPVPVPLVGANPTVYVVLLGDAALKRPDTEAERAGTLWAEGQLLEAVDKEDIEAQTGTGDDALKYAIFRIDPTTGKAVVADNRARADVINPSVNTRMVILRKVVESEGVYLPLSGATFKIFYADRQTPVTQIGEDGKPDTEFTSDASGVYFVGDLPEGKYYLWEQTTPEGYKAPTAWFVLEVTTEGVTQTLLEGSDSALFPAAKSEEAPATPAGSEGT